jgi:hypothetical protein
MWLLFRKELLLADFPEFAHPLQFIHIDPLAVSNHQKKNRFRFDIFMPYLHDLIKVHVFDDLKLQYIRIFLITS